MKETLVMYARYSKKANASVFGLLDKMSVAERDVDRKAYYKSLGGLAAHLLDGTVYFLGLFRGSFPLPSDALAKAKGIAVPQIPLGDEGWERLKAACAEADDAALAFFDSLSEGDCGLPIKLDWYGGNPPEVPLHFLAHQLIVHGIHHRGQISQILDSLGIEHDFSGIDLGDLPR
jgi:uncharacterized damage-inducible protein DinB